nr:immunoglobulin heavy chain junction region [Macaca mulatta]
CAKSQIRPNWYFDLW